MCPRKHVIRGRDHLDRGLPIRYRRSLFHQEPRMTKLKTATWMEACDISDSSLCWDGEILLSTAAMIFVMVEAYSLGD